MLKKLEKIRNLGLQKIEEAKTISELQEITKSLMGKKSELTEVLKNMSFLANEEKKNVGIVTTEIKNIFNEKGTDLPTIAKTPRENAISVAVGIAHPCSNPVPLVMYKKMRAGNATPNKAEIAGNIA